jgi:hypothetical protein
MAKKMAVIIGPRSSAAGRFRYSKQSTKTKETISKMVDFDGVDHWDGVLQRDKKGSDMSIIRKISGLV